MVQLGTVGQEAGFQCLLRTPSWEWGGEGLSWEVLTKEIPDQSASLSGAFACSRSPCSGATPDPSYSMSLHALLPRRVSLSGQVMENTEARHTDLIHRLSAHQLSPCRLKGRRRPAGRGSPGFPPASSRNRSLTFSASTSCTRRLAVPVSSSLRAHSDLFHGKK